MEWISTKDRLPEIGEQVLTYSKTTKPFFNELRPSGFWLFAAPGFGIITHWMKIDPPKQ